MVEQQMDTLSVLCVTSTDYMQHVLEDIENSEGNFNVETADSLPAAKDQISGAEHDCIVLPDSDDDVFELVTKTAYSKRVPVVVCQSDSEHWSRDTVPDKYHDWVHTTLTEDQPTNTVPTHISRVVSNQQLTLELLNQDYLSALLAQYSYVVDNSEAKSEVKTGICEAFTDSAGYPFAAVITLTSDHSSFVIEQGSGMQHPDLPHTVSLENVNEEFASAVVDTYIEDTENICFNLPVDSMEPFCQDESHTGEAYPDGLSVLTTPLSRETVDFGILLIGSNQPAGFDPRERTMLVYLARWCAHALHRLETENRLQQVKKNLRNRDAQIDAIVGALSHDLRNPLNTAKGYTERAIETDDLEHLDWVEESHTRMVDLIDDVIELAQTRDIEHHEATIPLGNVAENVWAKIDTEEGTLNVVTDTTVNADAERLRAMLKLLFSNSITHGGSDVTVTIRGTANGFTITDDGVGFGVDNYEKLFRAGYSTTSDSTGLGLTIVKRIVDAHGWEITAGTSEEGGAKYTIRTTST